MTELQRINLINDTANAIGAIKARYQVDVIKSTEIPELVNMETMQAIGLGVKLQLNTKYNYTEELLTKWKNMLNADEWELSVKRGQLVITFKVKYK